MKKYLTDKELIIKYKNYPKGYCIVCKGWRYLFLGIKNNKNIVKKCQKCKEQENARNNITNRKRA